MTGFARVRGTIGKVEVTISVKAVNHRGLDLHFYMGPEMDPFEAAMRSTIKRHVGRGHLDIRVQLVSSRAVQESTSTIHDCGLIWQHFRRQRNNMVSKTSPT